MLFIHHMHLRPVLASHTRLRAAGCSVEDQATILKEVLGL